MAEWTGFEPATPGVTGRYSNQLNYHSGWWVLRGSNPRPSPCKGDALPAELSTPGREPPGIGRSVYGILQGLASLETRYIPGSYLNGFPCAWTTAGARGPLLHAERTKTHNRYMIATLQRRSDAGHNGVHGSACVCF